MKLIDVARDAIDEASEKLGDSYFLNEEKHEKLDEICDLTDEIIQVICDEFGCEIVTVECGESEKGLIIDIVCDEIILQDDMTNKFCALSDLVDSIRFSKATAKGKPDKLRIEIVLYGLWIGGVVYE